MEITEEKIEQVAQKIAKEYKPEKIILFGSYAWGKPTPESDADLFVIKDTEDSVVERHKKVGRLLFGVGFPVDVLVYTPSQVKRRMDIGDSFMRDIISKGKILYVPADNQKAYQRFSDWQERAEEDLRASEVMIFVLEKIT